MAAAGVAGWVPPSAAAAPEAAAELLLVGAPAMAAPLPPPLPLPGPLCATLAACPLYNRACFARSFAASSACTRSGRTPASSNVSLRGGISKQARQSQLAHCATVVGLQPGCAALKQAAHGWELPQCGRALHSPDEARLDGKVQRRVGGEGGRMVHLRGEAAGAAQGTASWASTASMGQWYGLGGAGGDGRGV